MSKSKAFVTGLLFGGVAAGVTVLFAAPSSGKDFRKKLTQKGIELKRSFQEIKNDSKLLKEQVIQTAVEGKEVFGELKDDMQKAFSAWTQDIKPNKENIERKLEEIQKSIDHLQKTVPAKK